MIECINKCVSNIHEGICENYKYPQRSQEKTVAGVLWDPTRLLEG